MKNTFWAIPITLVVAAKNKQEAKRILWAQIEEIAGDNIDNCAMFAEDYCGVMGYTAGALQPTPDPKFEKMFRKTWGEWGEPAAEPFTKRAGDGLAGDEQSPEDQRAWLESFHKKTGKRRNKR